MFNNRSLKSDNQGLMRELVDNFLSAKPKKRVFGNFKIKPDGIIYETETMRDVSFGKDNASLARDLKARHGAGEIRIDAENLYRLNTYLSGKNNWVRICYHEAEANIVAKRIKREGKDDLLLGNSSILPLIGRTVAYGRVRNNNRETLVQRILAEHMRMIPFSIFEQANLDLNKINLVDQTGDETLTRKVKNPNYKSWLESSRSGPEFITQNIHFTGASLFEVEGRYFLFDINREEIKHKIFNPFVVELKTKATSIKQAYESLKPSEVIKAEKQGKKVLRQGEWFFIPSAKPKMPKVSKEVLLNLIANASAWRAERFEPLASKKLIKEVLKRAQKLSRQVPMPLQLKAGQNRPNNAELGLQVNKKTFVTGKIVHSGREHRDLVLKGWYQAVPNTAVKSVTITGDID